jgi:hypothetical protein
MHKSTSTDPSVMRSIMTILPTLMLCIGFVLMCGYMHVAMANQQTTPMIAQGDELYAIDHDTLTQHIGTVYPPKTLQQFFDAELDGLFSLSLNQVRDLVTDAFPDCKVSITQLAILQDSGDYSLRWIITLDLITYVIEDGTYQVINDTQRTRNAAVLRAGRARATGYSVVGSWWNPHQTIDFNLGGTQIHLGDGKLNGGQSRMIHHSIPRVYFGITGWNEPPLAGYHGGNSYGWVTHPYVMITKRWWLLAANTRPAWDVAKDFELQWWR